MRSHGLGGRFRKLSQDHSLIGQLSANLAMVRGIPAHHGIWKASVDQGCVDNAPSGRATSTPPQTAHSDAQRNDTTVVRWLTLAIQLRYGLSFDSEFLGIPQPASR